MVSQSRARSFFSVCVPHSLGHSLSKSQKIAAREDDSLGRRLYYSLSYHGHELGRHRNFWRYYSSCARGRTEWVRSAEDSWVYLAYSERLGSRSNFSTHRSGTETPPAGDYSSTRAWDTTCETETETGHDGYVGRRLNLTCSASAFLQQPASFMWAVGRLS